MAASAVEICSRKKRKANRPSESEKILLGHYIRLIPGSQESRVYLGAKLVQRGKQINRNFRIKSLLSQNWGHMFTPKFGEKNTGTRSFQNCVDQEINCMRIDIS